ncbi:GIY-YIG endonuclease (mitochondrion) [Podila verticillata NRRL 6337]|uniref:GIY-YIG endonuclease n=1 Tax=Podila verticillata NRRL 6337 TaxID=1069443 RepID=A0A086VL81_9FUNG|nr:GIY-YIG endonuclease [Podila verticillata NRRL 6337]
MDSLSPKYNILSIADSLLGYVHRKESITKMSETKKDKNHPMFGKTGENSPRGMLVFIYSFNTLSNETTLYKSFDNYTEAAKYLECSKHILSRYIDKNKLFKKQWKLSTSLIT